MAVEQNILFGGDDAAPMDPTAKTVGELVLKKLAEYDGKTVLVIRI